MGCADLAAQAHGVAARDSNGRLVKQGNRLTAAAWLAGALAAAIGERATGPSRSRPRATRLQLLSTKASAQHGALHIGQWARQSFQNFPPPSTQPSSCTPKCPICRTARIPTSSKHCTFKPVKPPKRKHARESLSNTALGGCPTSFAPTKITSPVRALVLLVFAARNSCLTVCRNTHQEAATTATHFILHRSNLESTHSALIASTVRHAVSVVSTVIPTGLWAHRLAAEKAKNRRLQRRVLR